MARTGQLKVKEWETTLAAEIGIFLNLAEADYPVGDWFWLSESGIELAASPVQQLSGGKETLGFYCNGKLADMGPDTVYKFPPKNGHEQGKRIMTFLAGVALNKKQPYIQLFKEAHHLKNGSSLIFITPLISTGMLKIARNLQRAGYHPLFLRLESPAGGLTPAELQRAEIPWYTVAIIDALGYQLRIPLLAKIVTFIFSQWLGLWGRIWITSQTLPPFIFNPFPALKSAGELKFGPIYIPGYADKRG